MFVAGRTLLAWNGLLSQILRLRWYLAEMSKSGCLISQNRNYLGEAWLSLCWGCSNLQEERARYSRWGNHRIGKCCRHSVRVTNNWECITDQNHQMTRSGRVATIAEKYHSSCRKEQWSHSVNSKNPTGRNSLKELKINNPEFDSNWSHNLNLCKRKENNTEIYLVLPCLLPAILQALQGLWGSNT